MNDSYRNLPATATPVRLGAVEYLNTAPLVRRLGELAPTAEVCFDLPSRLADRLAAGELDVALAPIVEIARHPEWRIVSDACIACRGPVLSVKLFLRRPPADVRTLALDEGSRTSAVLAQVLLGERYGVRPALKILPMGATVDDSTADAVLMIGDRAIRARTTDRMLAWDLGERWQAMTGLPFVFAAWAVRPGVAIEPVGGWLAAARDAGLKELDAIVAERSAAMDLPREVVDNYLRNCLHFTLADQERQGLDLFLRLAGERGLITLDAGVSCDDCVVPG